MVFVAKVEKSSKTRNFTRKTRFKPESFQEVSIGMMEDFNLLDPRDFGR